MSGSPESNEEEGKVSERARGSWYTVRIVSEFAIHAKGLRTAERLMRESLTDSFVWIEELEFRATPEDAAHAKRRLRNSESSR